MKVDFPHKILFGAVVFLMGSLPLFSQHKVKIEKKYSEIDYAAQIEGIYDGDIQFSTFCSSNGLTTKIGAKIITFDLYFCKAEEVPVHIIGNEIPDSICADIKNNCLFTDVFINNIKAMDIDGSVRNLNPVHYFIKPE